MVFVYIVVIILVLIALLLPVLTAAFYVFLCVAAICGIYLVWETIYFRGEKFAAIKESVQQYVQECNELNVHIEELKKAYMDIRHTDYGTASYTDDSQYHFRRQRLRELKEEKNTYECSLSVCKNAQQQPFKYICKYFNIATNEETLTSFEKVFNDFSAAEQGKTLLKNKRDEIINGIGSKIPTLIKKIRKKTLARKLGFEDIRFSDVYFPTYSFRYVSAGGNSSMKCDVVFDLDNIERFINYLSDIVKFKKSAAGQRAIMTAHLREKIKERDNYTCQKCGLSTFDEPHLLLEIDHIIPVAKGGLTTEENLQTLCWKCNRTKGSKM